ncbi:MAG: MFS transporter, partial [Bdellovibrionota bacterium]
MAALAKPVPELQKKVVRLFYCFQFFFSLLLWLPIFYEFQKRAGLSDVEVFRIQTIYYVVFCLLEIPTGYLADSLGRRACVRSGSVVLTLANLLPVFTQTYAGTLSHFLLIALARSLISGAASAYLYDFLKEQGASSTLYRQVEGNARAYGLIGKVILWPVMGTLMNYQLTLPYLLTTLASATSVLFAWSLPLVHDGMGAESKLRGRVKGLSFLPAFQALARTPVLVLVIFQGVSVFVLDRITQVNLFQPVLQLKHFDVQMYGIVLSIMTVFEAWGASHTAWLRRWVSDLHSVFALTLVLAGSLVVIGEFGKIGVVIAFSVYALATGMVFPIQRQLLNDVIPDSRYRATLLSMESLVDRAVCAYVASFLGVFVTTGRIQEFLYIAAAVTG